jgi:hypothetical protein
VPRYHAPWGPDCFIALSAWRGHWWNETRINILDSMFEPSAFVTHLQAAYDAQRRT